MGTVVIRSETGKRIHLRSLAAESLRRRAQPTICCVLLAFATIAGQLVRLSLKAGPEIRIAIAEPLTTSWSRPDIVDRKGRLIATDVAVNSLYADPHQILDLDEVV